MALYRAVYGDAHTLTADVEEPLLDGRVPNLILQPLVENALVHGRDAETRTIHISACREGSRLQPSEADNGGAIDPAVVQTVTQASGDNQLTCKMKGFGLRCVLQRLYMLHGDNQSLSAACQWEKESRICLNIPWQCYAAKEAV